MRLIDKIVGLFTDFHECGDLGAGATTFDLEAGRQDFKTDIAPSEGGLTMLITEVRNRFEFWRIRL